MNAARLSALCALTTLLACGGGESPLPVPGDVDYHRDAVAVLDRYCTSCHQAGGIAPFALTEFSTVKAHAQALRSAVQSGRMPPWMPSDRGVPLRFSRAMRPEDRELLLRWVDAGAPEGDPGAARRTDIPPAETLPAVRPDIVLDPGVTYQPNPALSDDYRCFITDPKLAEDTYLSGGDIRPGSPSLVHHVIVYEVKATDAAAVQRLDAAEAGAGYTCFGGPGAAGQTLLVWAPGSVPMRAPEGLAMRVSKGSLLVIQVHYNLLNSTGQGDHTTAVLEKSPTRPQKIAVLLGAAKPDELSIKAGDAKGRQLISIPMLGVLLWLKTPSLLAYGNVPHMHQLGTRIQTSLADGRVLLEAPRWDFHWQQYYQFKQPVLLGASDTLLVECDYDNSAANQPVVNGQQRTPRDVRWGEKTTDEMCLSYVQVAVDPSTQL